MNYLEARPEQGSDLDFRPYTYWPSSRTREMLLSRIKGKVRRHLAREALETGGIKALNDFMAREELSADDRREWGRIHPWLMGGEYLPSLRGAEVEIASLSIASTLNDQISIRAKPCNGHIRVYAVDEHDYGCSPAFRRITEPFTMRELISFIDGTNFDMSNPYGLVWGPTLYCFECENDVDAAAGFVTIDSAYYPELGSFYSCWIDAWADAEREQMSDPDELDEEG